MTKITKSIVVAATIMGLLISISSVSVNAYGQKNKVNLTEFESFEQPYLQKGMAKRTP